MSAELVPPLSRFMGSSRVGTASWADLKRLIVFYSLLLAASLVGGLFQHFLRDPKINIYFLVVWVVITAIFATKEWPSVSRAFKPRRIKVKVLLQLLGISSLVVGFLTLYFILFRFTHLPLAKVTEEFTKAHWPVWSIFALVSIAPGVFEEIAFRGVIQTKLSEILSAREALIIQAALFSVLHLSPLIFISHFIMGLLLGWMRLRAGHVYYGMVAHAGWNAACILHELGYF